MRTYKKTTQHPYCIYLTKDEATEVLNEISSAFEHAGENGTPTLRRLWMRLNPLLAS